MVSELLYKKVLECKEQRDLEGKPLKIQIYGDKNQCEPFMNRRYYHYQDTRYFRELAGFNLMEKKFYKESATNRFDYKLYALSQFLLKNNRLPKPIEFYKAIHDKNPPKNKNLDEFNPFIKLITSQRRYMI